MNVVTYLLITYTLAMLNPTQQVIRNTFFLYLRQIVAIGLNLYTVRLILNILGADDYGLYNVVGGIVTMFAFVVGAMANASQRYFSFAIGKKEEGLLKRTFDVTILSYLLLSLVILALAQTIGLYFVLNKITLPPERITAALWVYQFSVLNFAISFLSMPFIGLVFAYEKMNIYAFVSILDALVKLLFILLLPYLQHDKLILYAAAQSLFLFLSNCFYLFYTQVNFKLLTIKFSWDKSIFKEMLSYTSWNLIGASGRVFKVQGINLILNNSFGLAINAARAVASQVSGIVSGFSQNFTTAVRPQIIKRYAAQDYTGMVKSVFTSSKLTFTLLSLAAIPIIIEMPQILTLWLKEVPEHTVIFTRLVLIDALIDSISYPLMTSAQATGRVKLYHTVIGTILLLNLPIAWIAIHFGAPAYAVMIIAIVLTGFSFIARLSILRKLIPEFSVRLFFLTVALPLFSTTLLVYLVVTGMTSLIPVATYRIFISILSYIFLLLLCSYLFVLSKEEKEAVQAYLKKKRKSKS